MAVKTTLEQLEEVQAAITKVMSAESYTMAEVKVQRSRLSALSKREEMLLARYRRETNNKGRIRLNLTGGV